MGVVQRLFEFFLYFFAPVLSVLCNRLLFQICRNGNAKILLKLREIVPELPYNLLPGLTKSLRTKDSNNAPKKFP